MNPIDMAVRYLAGLLLLSSVAFGGLARCEYLTAQTTRAELDRHLSDDRAAVAERERIHAQQDAAYAAQVKEATDAQDAARRQLADLRSRPVPRLVCHSATDVQPATGSQDPASSASEPTGDRELPAGSGAIFDPGPAVLRLADRADDLVEQCRGALAKWPR